MNAFMRAQAGLLSEALVTDFTLERAHFVDQRSHVILYNVQNNYAQTPALGLNLCS